MLSLLLATLPGLARAPAQDEAASTLALLRTPEHALQLAGANAADRARFMLPLLRTYAELLGWKLMLEPELEAELAQLETGLYLPAEIARADVHPLVQSLARARGLCFRLDSVAGQALLRVEHDRSAQTSAAPISIPPELLPAWSNHPAFLLCVEIAHPSEGSEELCRRLRALLAQCASRADVVRMESGALRLTASAAILEFVAEALREGSWRAQGLEAATFPPDPNTPEGKAAAVLPPNLRTVFPQQDGPLVLHEDDSQPSELAIAEAYGRWAARPLLFLTGETRAALAPNPGAADTPKSVPPAWVHEFVSGGLADAGCALAPLPAEHPVLWTIEKHPQGKAVGLDPGGIPTIRLADLAAVAHLAATRFQAFVRLPKLDAEQLRGIGELQSPDVRAPFWITQLDDPQVFSVIGTPRAITSAVLGLKLILTQTKAR